MSNRYPRSIASKLLMIACIFAAGQVAHAAETNWDNLKAVRAGEEARFTLRNGKSYRGSFQSVNKDAMVVRLNTSEQTFTKDEITRVATKGRGRRGRNTLIGLVVGTGAGIGIGAAVDAGNKGFPNIQFGKPILGAVGAIAGTALGFFLSSGWHEVYRAP